MCCLFLFFLLSAMSSLYGFHIDNIGPSNKPLNQSIVNPQAKSFFISGLPFFRHEKIATSPLSLLQAAKDTLYHIRNKKGNYRQALEPKHFKNIVSFKKVEETLEFIISIIEEDKKTGSFRILDPAFLNEHFDFLRWKADRESALKHDFRLPQNGNVRLTNYVIYNVRGSSKKTVSHNCPLYMLLDRTLAKKFSKQTILSGVFEKAPYKNKVRALAWLTRSDFEDVLLQGSVLVTFPNNTHKIFMVDICNGIKYEKKIRDTKKQRRYWYYRDAKSNIASLALFKKRVTLRKNVILAGDIYNIGVGKIIAFRHINQITKTPEVYLGVLADTGGAFINNLYQMDLFLGMFSDKKLLKKEQKQFPVTTQAYIMYKRS